MPNILTFEDLTPNSNALKKLVQAFTRAGTPVATVDTDGRSRRSSGITYRDLVMTFVDNQKAVFSIKKPGDIFQVKINGSVVPLKNQDDQVKAVGEISRMLDASRAKHQAKLARVKVAMPSGIKTAAPRMEVQLSSMNEQLDAEIASAQEKLSALQAELGEQVLDSVGEPKLIEIDEALQAKALALAESIVNGEVLDDVTPAIEILNQALYVVDTNYPINMARGNIDQAELEKANSASFKAAIDILKGGEVVLDSAVPAEKSDGKDAHPET